MSAEVRRVGVLGAGTMGAGIAQVAAQGGYETIVYDPDPAAQQADTGELAALAGCELIVEAAPEALDLKRELLASVAVVCGPETILATNTSSLRVAEIAAGVPGPERLVGMHFFNPPTRMKLVEVVATEESSEAAVRTAIEVAERMGRTPIRVRDTVGFLANRLARPFNLEALRMLGQGLAGPEEIDRAYKQGGGFRMGPFELIDLIGLDVNLTIARSFFAQGGEPERWRPSPIQERMVGEGLLGRKSGRGFYAYGDDPSHSGSPYSRQAGQKRHAASGPTVNPAAEEILLRLHAQIANEAHFALEDKIGSPADMNTATRLGLNWPRGSLEIAEELGPSQALATLERLEAAHGAAYAPAPLLRETAGR